MEILSKTFAILGTFFVIATYFRYGYQVKKMTSTPSIITLLLWLIEGVINACTYWKSVGDIWQTLGAIATPILSLGILFLCFYLRRFNKIKWIEIASIALALLIGFFWLKSGDHDLSNILLQFIYAISFMPIGYNIIKGIKEDPTAWNLAIISYAFSTLTVLCNYTGNVISLLFYGVNGIGNIVIVILIFSFRNKKAD